MNAEFFEFLTERLRERGLSPRRASELTGIPLNHLECLCRGEIDKLPPAPYVHGYIVKLAKLLDFDPETRWQELKRSGAIKMSGAKDELPKNRFALEATNKYLWLAAVGAAVLIYFGFRFSQILGKPELSVIYPSEGIVVAAEEILTVTGEVRRGDELSVNSDPVAIPPDGRWQKRVKLELGLNTIQVTAKKFLGGETKVLRQVVYQPAALAATSTLE